MKHVFIIHSNTVLLSALGAIEYEKIKKEDIFFLYARNFSSSIVDKGIKKKDIGNIYTLSRTNFTINICAHKKIIKVVDEFIKCEIGEDYVLYIPHAGIPFCIFATNKRCQYTCFLQEGAYGFFDYNFSYKVLLKNIFFSNIRMWWNSTWDIPPKRRKSVNLRKTYAISKDIFEALDYTDNVIIKWPRIDDPRLCFPSESDFYLFDSCVEQKYVSLDDYIECCKLLVDEGKNNISYIQFHPAQDKETKRKILLLFQNKNYTILDGTVPFELILSSNSKLNLFGFSTSLLKFGEDMGHNITCKISMIYEKSNRRFKKHIKIGHYKIFTENDKN